MANIENRVVVRICKPTAKLAVIRGTDAVVVDPAVPVRGTAAHRDFLVGVKTRDGAAAFRRMTIE